METKLNYVAKIEGRAAEMIIDKMSEMRKQKNITISKSRATQMLLCELFNARQLNKDIKPCEE